MGDFSILSAKALQISTTIYNYDVKTGRIAIDKHQRVEGKHVGPLYDHSATTISGIYKFASTIDPTERIERRVDSKE